MPPPFAKYAKDGALDVVALLELLTCYRQVVVETAVGLGERPVAYCLRALPRRNISFTVATK